MQQAHTRPSPVPCGAKPEGDTQAPQPWTWVEASIWTKRMLAALDNGVTGGRWYSLMDKVTAPRTLAAAWKRVAANKGAAGVDGISITRFKARASHYLAELARDLRAGRYQPLPARRVHISKGQGQTRPLGISAVKDRIVQTPGSSFWNRSLNGTFSRVTMASDPGVGVKTPCGKSIGG